MMTLSPTPVIIVMKKLQPWALLAGAGLYALGCGIAHYLGYGIHWGVYWLGQGTVFLLQAGGYLLDGYFGTFPASFKADFQLQTPKERMLTRQLLLLASLTVLATGAVLTVILVMEHAITTSGFILLGLAFLIMMVYATPPVRLSQSGYGEIAQAFLLGSLTPGLGYLYQVGTFHRLLPLLTVAPMLMYLAAHIALSLPSYASDLEAERRTLMTRLGWQKAMNLHNLLILLVYLSLGLTTFFGLPWRLVWPAMLTIPVGLFQIFQMMVIAGGGKPRWNLLRLTSGASLAMLVYLLALTLWIN